MKQRFLQAILLSLAVGAVAQPSFGVAEVKIPIPTLYAGSKAIGIGTIVKFTPESGVVQVNVATLLKGEGFPGPYHIIVRDEELKKSLAVDQTVVLMIDEKTAKRVTIHLGDKWALAEVKADGKGPTYIVRGPHAELNHTHPGRTTAVIALLQELKASGKASLLDRTDPRVLTGGVKELGKLPVGGIKAITAADLDGDKKPELVVSTEQGVKVFSWDGKTFAPSKAPAPAGFPAEGPKPIANADETHAGAALAWTIGDFGEAGQATRLVTRPRGIFRESPESTKTPIDEFERITGDALSIYPFGFDKGIDWAAMTSIDINGDGKRDVVVMTASSGAVLVNRGYGAFFVIANLPRLMVGADKPLPFKLGPGTFLAGADVDGDGRDDLLVVNAEGQVWAVLNPAPKAQ
jgi:hypothetical protein